MWKLLAIIGVLFAVLSVVYLLLGAMPTRAREGRVIGVVGLMGSGKTLWAVREARKRLRAGGIVATNFTMELPDEWADRWVRFSSWEELASLRNCTVILDEAHLFAPASVHFKLPPTARWAMSMARHLHMELIWITQHESRVTVGLRELTCEYVQCKRSLGFNVGRSFEPEVFRKAKAKPLWVAFYRPGKKLRALYDTSELIMPDGSYDSDGKVASIVSGHRQAEGTRQRASAAE